MEAERRRRAHAIFTAALDASPTARDEMVDAACAGDTELGDRVRRLVAAADDRTDFLEIPAIAAAQPATNYVPDAVGNYLVVGVLGVGGMAAVYEAVQENPHRRVALKVLHQGMTRTAALRFRLETEALALFHHPGIAQIYEAGTAHLGQRTPSPFFAMELVPDARTITDDAVRRNLPLAERLAMFAQVCDAVLHGHQHGIIHRDLKPGNILVGSDGRPKVIDFGIARMTESAPGGASSLTAETDARKIIGTLNYMSPEQCERPGGIDIRADVYALGVVLYQLVTRRLPHDLTRCSIPQAIRIITTDAPVPAGDVCAEARGDLGAIIAKAMAKDRADRYVGAGALGDDIRRFLAMRPVEARPPTAIGQLVRFARRNRALAATAAAALLALVSGTLVASHLAVVAGRSRDDAVARARELETVTGFQESLLSDMDPQAIGDQIRRELTDKLGPSAGSLSTVNFTTLAIDILRESILARQQGSIARRFADQPLLRARMLMQLSDTMRTLGLYAQAEPAIREAISCRLAELGDDHEDTLLSKHAMGSLLMTLDRPGEAIPLLRDTHARMTRVLGPDSPMTLRLQSTLAGALRRSGEPAAAGELWTGVLAAQRRILGDDHADTLRTLGNLGIALVQQGRKDQAETCWRELLERRKRLFGENSPEYGATLGNLGVLLQDQGRLDEARAMIEQSLAVDRRRKGDRHTDTLVTIAQLAELNADAGDLDAAEKLERECWQGRVDALGPAHRDTLRAQAFLASILHDRGQVAEADRLATDALRAQRAAHGDDHQDTLFAMNIAARVAFSAGRTQEALEQSTHAVARSRALPSMEPGLLGRIVWRHGGILLDAGETADAERTLLEAHRLLESAVGPTHPHTRHAALSLASFYRTTPPRGTPQPAKAAEWTRRAGPESAPAK